MTSMKISNFFTPSLPCHIHDHATYQYSCPLFDYPLPPSSADVIDGSPLTAVHDKIKNHVCDECGYEASEKRTLISHRASVHKIGDHKFKCVKCPYKSNHSANLKKHILGVHDKIRNHVCKVCGFATSWKGTLNRHRATVHCKKV